MRRPAQARGCGLWRRSDAEIAAPDARLTQPTSDRRPAWRGVIRLASEADFEHLLEVERSAGRVFLNIRELAWLSDDDVQPIERHRKLAAQGTNWVALDDSDSPIGFLSAEVVFDEMHIWEMSVDETHQRVGVGRAFVEQAVQNARSRGLNAVTLTTFRNVPWNGPYYARLGFEYLMDCDVGERLAAILQAEAEHGLNGRCAMRLEIQ